MVDAMASKWIEQGWVSVNDLLLLGWGRDSIDAMKTAVPEQIVALGGMTRARDLNEVNSWARNHGESIVSSQSVRKREKNASSGSGSSSKKSTTGSKARSTKPSNGFSQSPPPPSPAAFQAARVSSVQVSGGRTTSAKQAARIAHQQKRASQTWQAQATGTWFESKREANDSGFLSAVDLKDRLWTDSLVEKLLGEPDGLGHNYYNPSTPVRYWTADHVLQVEGSDEFLGLIGASLSRRRMRWETGVDAISNSNRTHGLLDGRAMVPWSLALAKLL